MDLLEALVIYVVAVILTYIVLRCCLKCSTLTVLVMTLLVGLIVLCIVFPPSRLLGEVVTPLLPVYCLIVAISILLLITYTIGILFYCALSKGDNTKHSNGDNWQTM